MYSYRKPFSPQPERVAFTGTLDEPVTNQTPILAPLGAKGYDYCYKISHLYRNTLSYPVVLTDRNNLSKVLPIQPVIREHDSKSLRVDIVIEFSDDVLFDCTHVLDLPENQMTKELRTLKHALLNNTVSLRYGGKSITISYIVTDNILKRNGYMFYSDELDVVISRQTEFDPNTVHPYSNIGQKLIIASPSDMFEYKIMINDPKGLFGDRYININNTVYKVPLTTDPQQPAGVYVYTNTGEDSEPIYHSFDEAQETLGLYTTRALAQDYGNPQDAYKRKLEEEALKNKANYLEKEKELQQQAHALKQEELALKSQYEKEDLIRKTEQAELNQRLREHEYTIKKLTTEKTEQLAKLKAELEEQQAIRDREMAELKYKMDMRSYNRKDTSETIKWLPTIVGGILSLGALLIAL